MLIVASCIAYIVKVKYLKITNFLIQKKPSTKRQKTRQTKLTPVKSTTTTKKKPAQLDLAKLQD